MQVALWSVGEVAERVRRTADDLVAAGLADVGRVNVVVLAERSAASLPVVVGACDLLVLLVSSSPDGGRAGQPDAMAAAGGPLAGASAVGAPAVGAPAGPDLDAADAVVASASAARHVTVVAGAPGPLDERTERWLTRVATEHTVTRGTDVVAVVAAALAERRRCLFNPQTDPAPWDRANEPREGRTLDEVGIGDPQPRAAPPGDQPPGDDRAGADEQWNEAVQAWRAELWEVMVRHLQRALDRRPLDLDAGLWLARALAASQSVSGRAEAVRRATDAARVAEQKGRLHWAAAAWLWVARLERRDDPAATLGAADRAGDLVGHRAEPWIERALTRLGLGDGAGASADALAAYRHHERSLRDLAEDPFSHPDPAETERLEDHVRQASFDRLVQLLQLASRVGAEVGTPDAFAAPRLTGSGELAPPSPIGPQASDALAAMSLEDLADEGRRLSGVVHAALRRWAAALAEEGRALASPDAVPAGAVMSGAVMSGAMPAGTQGAGGAAGRATEREQPTRRAIHDRESLAWGLAGAGAVAACGVGLWWVTGSALLMLLGVALALGAVAFTARAATDPAAAREGPEGGAGREPEVAEGSPPTATPTATATATEPGLPPPLATPALSPALAPGSAATWPPSDIPPPALAGGPSVVGNGAPPPRDPIDHWRVRLQALGEAIERAEALTLDWPRLGPAVPAYRAQLGDLVALASAGALGSPSPSAGPGPVAPGDDDWLPGPLRRLAGPLPESEPPPPARLYRLMPAADSDAVTRAQGAGSGSPPTGAHLSPRAVRWATYFEP